MIAEIGAIAQNAVIVRSVAASAGVNAAMIAASVAGIAMSGASRRRVMRGAMGRAREVVNRTAKVVGLIRTADLISGKIGEIVVIAASVPIDQIAATGQTVASLGRIVGIGVSVEIDRSIKVRRRVRGRPQRVALARRTLRFRVIDLIAGIGATAATVSSRVSGRTVGAGAVVAAA